MAALQYNCDAGLAKAPTFHPSLWGDFFLTYQPPVAPQGIGGLGLSVNLVHEISMYATPKFLKSESMMWSSNALISYDVKDLNLVSLRFYLLRKHGYDVSSDVFLNFKDKEGNFASDDIRSLLSLYNASYLRTHGEEVLDEAIIFTRSHLEATLTSLESKLADEVSLTLQTPLFRRVKILETRNYIPIYEMEPSRNEAVLEFAKLNFNLLQILYCEELKTVTAWWKQLNVETDLSFIRDRIVEMHFWMAGACSEPKYSLSRVILTKMTAFITILDDIIDTHSTTEEGKLLVKAIDRCSQDAVEVLPDYMKDFYLFLLKTFDSCEDELGPNKRYRVFYLKEMLKILVRGYSQEIEWRDEHYVPETIDKHLEISRVTVGAFQLACSSFVGMGDIITKGVLDWLLTYPELLKCFTTFVRLSNDITSTEHSTTMHGACEKIKDLIEDSWKDMMQLYLTPTEQPKVVAQTIVDFARTGDYMYKKTDAFTFSHTIKDMIALLYVEPILF
ncbi:unnamed protein product [Miscanthus lutarioriparius]|uniref:Uncharacterized protein n=1 Tax=Miscanthus lutarioriparius TaxID=422564 RepID=A0A811SJJ5_9POAL|nr:unnamed protein product [Miscanthus lutarioriparius]